MVQAHGPSEYDAAAAAGHEESHGENSSKVLPDFSLMQIRKLGCRFFA